MYISKIEGEECSRNKKKPLRFWLVALQLVNCTFLSRILIIGCNIRRKLTFYSAKKAHKKPER